MNLPNSYDAWRTSEEPTYPKMRYIFLCEDCDNAVYEGNTYYEVDGFNYCENCINTYYRESTESEEVCSLCGESIPYDELATKIHGSWICDVCLDMECKHIAEE